MSFKPKLIRVTTVPLSMNIFCRGLLSELSEEYEVVAVTSPGAGFDEISLREGVRSVAVPMRRSISPLHDFVALCRLVRLFRRERPDLVHSLTPKAGLLSMMAARMAGVPVRIHTFTGLLFPTATGLKKQVLKLADRTVCACATHVHAEGQGVKHDLEQDGMARKPIAVLGHGNVRGIDLDYYARTPEVEAGAAWVRRLLKLSEKNFVFLFVGRLVRDKGVRELAEAFGRLSCERPDVRLIVAGEEERKAVSSERKAIGALGIHPHVYVAGWQEDVRPWYAAADALVLPSYREGFPNAVIEAGAMGLPAIVTDINGSREIITDGRNGVIVPPHDAETLYETMKSVAEQPERTRKMADEARPLVAARYEQGYVRRCLKEFYHSVLS